MTRSSPTYLFNSNIVLSLQGKTHGYPNIAELHGVNFLNRCSMRYVIERYNVSDPDELSPTAVALGMLNKEKLLADFFPYHSSKFRKIQPYMTEFFRECHTNGACRSPDFHEIFVNIQGTGISVEYGDEGNKKSLFMNWFENTFPIPSRFE